MTPMLTISDPTQNSSALRRSENWNSASIAALL
jgi:hypothetical protein